MAGTLEPLRKKPKKRLFSVFDIETSTDLMNVYLVGYYDGKRYAYYESPLLPPEHPDSAMTKFLRWYLSRATRRNLYAHNGGNFDSVFLLKSLTVNFPEFNATIIPSNSTILKLSITHPPDEWEWTILDSARTLPDSLNNLGLCFTGRGKAEFGGDYDTLHLNPLRYDYLKQDCVLLYNTLVAAFAKLEHRIGGRVSISAASTALATYRAGYQDTPIPQLGEKSDRLARAGYYGGRCEVFRKSFEGDFEHRLNYYDVNSMYPDALRQPMPFEVSKNETDCGFLDVTVEVPDTHVPVLPFRQKNKLLFPCGKFRGVYSTVELELARTQGVRIVQRHESIYYRTTVLFSDFVEKLYWLRNKENPDYDEATAKIAKLLLNSLYGKFGSATEREQIHLRPTVSDIASRGMVPMPSPIVHDFYIEKTTLDADYMLPHISAWVTALSRVKWARGAIECGAGLYYGDTDSLMSDVPMSDNVGPLLGQWKVESPRDPIVSAYFLAPKVYVLRHASGKLTNKAKGFARFGKSPMPDDLVARLRSGEAIEVSRMAKVRSVIKGEFGLVKSFKRIHNLDEKRVFEKDGTSHPRRIEQ